MKLSKALRYALITLFALFLIFIIVVNLIQAQIKAEDANNVQLHLPMGTKDTALVHEYTKGCTLTTLPYSEFPKQQVGMSWAWTLDDTYLSLIKELGVHWLRVDFQWRANEKPDGSYDWTTSDKIVKTATDHQLSLLATLTLLPANFTSWDEVHTHFRSYVHAFAERYATQGVHYYEIFNEPNFSGQGWLDSRYNPKDFINEYVILLAIANQEIHAVDKNAVVVSAGISSDDINAVPYPDVIRQMVSDGAKNCFDVFAFHPYGDQGKFAEVTAELRSLLAPFGRPSIPIWFNEFGSDKDEDLSYSVESLHKEQNVVDMWFWYTLRNLRPYNRLKYGLTDFGYVKKDAFYLFKEYFSNQ